MEHVSFLTLGLLFLLALVAGIIDSIAGGGGLLSIPGLLAAGLDPLSAIATSKLQGIFGSLSATIHYWRNKKIRLRDHIVPALAAFSASMCGAFALTFIDPTLLKLLVPCLLIAITLWLMLSPRLGEVSREARFSFLFFSLTFIPLIGFYNGFFGPCTGTFYAMSLVAFQGQNLRESTIRAKFYNMMSNLSAMLFFLYGGHIFWSYGLVMVAGTFIGGNLGARLVMKHGAKLIKPLLITMSLAMSVRLLWQQGLLQKFLS
jgi:uncharacterized membrane protein YfcA